MLVSVHDAVTDTSSRSRPISIEGLPLREGDTGEAVHELRRRLGRAGFITRTDPRASYGSETAAQVQAFQVSRGLHDDGTCGFQTWAALLEADHRFAERTLYLRQPMLRGDDVAELQRRLGSMGFDAGRIDGMFGPDTATAVAEYQQNVGLTVDGVCGHDSFAELDRVGSRAGQTSVATVRERERLLRPDPSANPARIVVGDLGALASLADRVGRVLASRGIDVIVVHHPDASSQATAANEHAAAAYLGLVGSAEQRCEVAYFATDGYISSGGRHLALLVSREVSKYALQAPDPTGMRMPVLRETRMPAVVCRLGPTADVGRSPEALAGGLGDAVVAWLQRPLDE